MDSLSDDSLISRIITIADIVDQMILNAWMYRWRLLMILPHYALFTKPIDLCLFLLAAAYEYRSRIALWSLWDSFLLLQTATVLATFLLCTCIILPHLVTAILKDEVESSFSPVLIPGRTTHTRLFPKAHKFSYPYLLVAVPVGLRANVNGLLSLDVDIKLLNAWQRLVMLATPYRVDGQDYLGRQPCAGGLRGKLDRFLKSKDINPDAFPHAVLVTSPKFLGYAFNPASFWYLYSPQKVLSAMVIEVNNTFGEMRPYLIFNETTPITDTEDFSNPAQSEGQDYQTGFRSNWLKDFHVSPFNSRKGRYSIKTADPMEPGMKRFHNVNITTALSSSKKHAKLVAKLFGEKQPIQVSSMSPIDKIAFVAKWTWIPFATFPQILYEAFRLYFNRALHTWKRPEPLGETVPRRASPEEEVIEKIFRDYLRWKVKTSNASLDVEYHPPKSMPDCTVESFIAPRVAHQPCIRQKVKFTALTPLFYSRFVAYDHDFDAIYAEHWEARTFDTDKFLILRELFSRNEVQPLRTTAKFELLFAKVIKGLRQQPAKITRPPSSEEKAQALSETVTESRSRQPHDAAPISPMDAYVWDYCTCEIKVRYIWALGRLFLAERLFWGFTEGLTMMQLIYRLLIARVVTTAFILPFGA